MAKSSKKQLTILSVLMLSVCQIFAAPANDVDEKDGPTKIELVSNAASYSDLPAEILSLSQYPQLLGLSPTLELPIPKLGDVIGLQLFTAGKVADSLGLKGSPKGSPNRIDDSVSETSDVDEIVLGPVMDADGEIKETGPYKLTVPRVGLFEPLPVKIEHAVGEEPLWRNKGLDVKDGIQTVIKGITQHKPIVDTITEEEKYGNTGDKLRVLNNAVVKGYEGFSRLYNAVLEVPRKFFENLSATVTDKLNNLGAKIDGL